MTHRLMIHTLTIGITTLLLTIQVASAGLLQTDSADPVEPKNVEVELNGVYTIDKARNGSVTAKCHSTEGDLTVTAGLTKGLDISLATPYTITATEKVGNTLASRKKGLNDITIDLKYQLLDLGGLKVAVKPGLILPTGKGREGFSDGKPGYAAALLATGEFAAGKISLHANAGYEQHHYKNDVLKHSTRADIYTISIAGEAEVATGLKLAADVGLATNSAKTDSTPLIYALIGPKYELSKDAEVYAGLKRGLTNPADDMAALFGIVLKF